MDRLLEKLSRSPALVRVVPFLIFLALTYGQGRFGESSPYWFYLTKTLVGAGLVWLVWPWVEELEWRMSWAALATGVFVFVLWIGLDGLYPSLETLTSDYLRPLLERLGLGSWAPDRESAPAPWNPHTQFGAHSSLAWLFVVVRTVGSTLVVPPLEEVFYRSFLYRYLVRPDFQSVPLYAVRWVPLLITATVFGFSHREWLAGILCGLAYQGLVCWKGRLGDAITAHAITNFLLALWVVSQGAWKFW